MKEKNRTWFERKHGAPPDPTRVNRSMPLSKVKPEDQFFLESLIVESIPDVRTTDRLKRGRWDESLNTLAIKDINEEEYARLDDTLRKSINRGKLDPQNNFHRQIIHSLRWEIHSLWRKDTEPKFDEIEEWLKG